MSFNKLEGEVPNKRPFKKFLAQSFIGNLWLSGDPPQLKLLKCKDIAISKPSKTNAIILKCILRILIAVNLLLGLTYVLIKCQKKTMQSILDANATLAT